METDLHVELPELLRIFAIQDAPRLMLFLGAGASARAGIPTAADMIWIFKREIFCSETGSSKEAFRDLSIERNREYLQQHFDAKRNFPRRGDPNEYSFYFERCYPDTRARRQFIRQAVTEGSPTIGHECVASLAVAERCHWIWTTNFDDLIERAQRADSPHRVYLVSPESRQRISTLMQEQLWPVLAKLHGDFQYDSLQNTSEELQEMDGSLRGMLGTLAQGNGIIVSGYSGRDESVMSAFEAALEAGAFMEGLYWCIRPGESPNPRVEQLVCHVREKTSRAGFVEVASFDELMFRLYRQCGLQDAAIDAKGKALFDHRRPFELVTNRKAVAPLKVNGIKVVEYPTTPYWIETSFSSWQELRDATGDEPIVVGLLAGHVMAFGSKDKIVKTCGDKLTGPVEVTDIRPGDLVRGNSVGMGLFYDIIERTLLNDFGLRRVGRRTYYIPDPAIEGGQGELTFEDNGTRYTVPIVSTRGPLTVNEAFTYQLDFHRGELWFVLGPAVVVTSDGVELAPIDQRKVVTNAVVSGRYNRAVHEHLLFWLHYLSSFGTPIRFSLPVADRREFVLTLDEKFAYSTRRA